MTLLLDKNGILNIDEMIINYTSFKNINLIDGSQCMRSYLCKGNCW